MKNRYCVWFVDRYHLFKTRYLAIKFAERLHVSAETIQGHKVVFSTSDKDFSRKVSELKPKINENRKHLDFLDLERH